MGHTEAITTGSLAGYNGARYLKGLKPMELPRQLATGDLIAYANERLQTREGLMTRYTFAGAEYFQRMQERELNNISPEEISNRVARTGLAGIYNEKII
ncbi:hypothetical protein SDC9_192848 [bioreactor metagenome]|uniref:Glucose-inhibited division protein A n=1 Tax=bioreactor metagenome TaxID=1076179 RepID=A0A645I1V2_9ZZZZ